MAYDPTNLSALAYANGFTLWHYKTADAADVVDNAGYFNTAVNMLRPGDFIIANAATASGVFVVKSNAGGVVNVSNLSPLGDQNTD